MILEYVKTGLKVLSFLIFFIVIYIAIKYRKYNLVLFAIIGFIANPIWSVPFCNGNFILTRGIYTIIIIVLFALNVNDVIDVVTKEDYESRDEVEKFIDKIDVGTGIASSILLIYVAFSKECSIIYAIVLILAPIVLMISLIIASVFSVFLGLTGFSLIKHLPSSVKKVNDILGFIPDPHKIITGKDAPPPITDDNKDISISESSIDRGDGLSEQDRNSTSYTSITEDVDISKSDTSDNEP